MTPSELVDLLVVAGRLKTTYRHCFTEGDRRESVGEHSWRIALAALAISGEPEFYNVDFNRVIKMCLIHDLGEAFTGDVPSFEKSDLDVEREDSALEKWIDDLSEPVRTQWKALLKEMDEQTTVEARAYKALDKLEAVLSHDESDISTWLPLEYDLQLEYGREEAAFSEYFKKLKEILDERTLEKISSAKTQRRE